MDRINIVNIPFVKTTLDDMAKTLVLHAQRQEKAFVVTANPEIVMKADQDPKYKEAVLTADYITADGIGIVKGAQLLGENLPERVAGFDLFMRLLATANEMEQSVYFLGASDDVLQKTLAVVETEFPNIRIAGSHHGFFDWEDSQIPDEIKREKPDYVFVALGLPRQEQWIASHIDQFDHGVFMGIGGSFDVLAGEVKRAPAFWQKLNLEWFYRLAMQPSRVKRMGALPQFGLRVLRERMKR
ncbi:WecB/TagA/CpsF family glycosyltransferase [Alkalicoccus urumqiensis]|uniref:N-acetylglucosaminyldiphosphoundecaprenol N-acetyl-beta-D-mannosaminyltransferase n=1 Tax=Alkalicoccus urumqiensis TaxID=1548213 RepID=A0A2P6MHD8_ALKUR|nr:WecB/TagA/CpsF family glycosyltransferase [Alkalicoccus urumqiensis]PRO65702.1 glycosyltransferase [Alkalicoccus urumqiensis]